MFKWEKWGSHSGWSGRIFKIILIWSWWRYWRAWETNGRYPTCISKIKRRPSKQRWSITPLPHDKFIERMQPSLRVDGKIRSLKEHQPLGEWWKNHILHRHDVKRAKETYLNDYLKFCKTISFENMIFVNERQQLLSRAMKLKSFDHLQSESVESRALDCS